MPVSFLRKAGRFLFLASHVLEVPAWSVCPSRRIQSGVIRMRLSIVGSTGCPAKIVGDARVSLKNLP